MFELVLGFSCRCLFVCLFVCLCVSGVLLFVGSCIPCVVVVMVFGCPCGLGSMFVCLELLVLWFVYLSVPGRVLCLG